MPSAWYVLHCKPNKEDILHQQLLYWDVEHYYPILKIKPVNPRCRKNRPFFPGYMFVYMDLYQQQKSFMINWLPGADSLVSFGGQAAEVPDHLIYSLKKKISKVDEEYLSENTFQKGDKIIITCGPFEGYEGIFDVRLTGKERAQVLIEFLKGRSVKIEVPFERLKKIAV
jgi:transcription elongation factor/antiterminator RfaH